MWGSTSYKKESFLFTTLFTSVVVIGYMIMNMIIKSFNLTVLPFFIVSTVLVLIKSILISYKSKWSIKEILSELELFIFSISLYMPIGLTYLFSVDIKTDHLPIIVNYLIFIPGNLVLYFGYLGIKTLHYRLTGKAPTEK